MVGGNCWLGFGWPHGVGVVLSCWNGTSEKSELMSDAFNNFDCSSAADGVDELDDDDLVDEDDELLDELLELLEELDDEDDDGLELEVAATLFLLPSSRVSRNAAIAMINTATTP